MKAIRTKYHGPTNTRGSRISASSGEKGQTVHISPDSINYNRIEQVHGAAARKLCEKMGWTGELIGGGFPDGTMVWCFANSFDRA